MNFQGLYFDGNKSAAYPCHIRIKPGGLSISYGDMEKGKTVFWEDRYITRTDISQRKVQLQFGATFPFQTIEFDPYDFWTEACRINPSAPYLKSPYHIFQHAGVKALLLGIVGIVGFALLMYFIVIPAGMELIADLIPRNTEVELGHSMARSILDYEKIDSSRTRFVNDFARQIDFKTTYPIHITVVHNSVQNAFALPGGEIVVYSAILDSMKNYEELVALLGHEVGHIEKRHTLKMLLKSLSNYIIISAILQDVSGIFAVLVDHAANVEKLSFNRKIEAESDQYGFEVMKTNRVNPQGMVDLFEQLNREGNDNIVPAFLNTHPKLSDRIRKTKERIHKEKISTRSNDSLKFYFLKIRK